MENAHTSVESRRPTSVAPRLLLGFGIIGLGVLFTLDNLGWVEADSILEYWPLILIVIGLVQLTAGQWLGALAWFLVGTILLLNSLDVVSVDLFDLWPVLLVLLGLHIVRKTFTRGRRHRHPEEPRINSFVLLSGHSRTCRCEDFLSGDVTAIMGGSEIDLRESEIEDGERVLDVFALWGAIDVRVPEDWTIVPRVATLLGAFEDSTDRSQADPHKRLLVRGMAVMGGVEVRN